jgi:hypothetical protein
MTLYDGDPCEGLADENILFIDYSLVKNHLFKSQYYYSLELLANEILVSLQNCAVCLVTRNRSSRCRDNSQPTGTRKKSQFLWTTFKVMRN